MLETVMICLLGRNAERTTQPMALPGWATGAKTMDKARKEGP